jgi:hypothetical protein
VGGINENADEVGEDELVEDVIDAEDVVEDVETNTKNQKRHYEAWIKNYNDMVSYYNTNSDCIVKHKFATVEGRMLGNWVQCKRKKFKAGVLSDDRINLPSDLQFNFLMQTNVVERKLTVSVAISNIFKYKKEHGNVAVPNKEPHKQLRCWIAHAKATSKKIIKQESVNPKFTLPNLKLLNELGTIQLPPNFKLNETTTIMHAKKEKKKKKKTKDPSKVTKPHGAQTTVSRVSVLSQRKKLLHHVQRPRHPSNQRSN